MKSSGESSSKSSFFSPMKSNLKASSAKVKSLLWQKSLREEPERCQSVDNIKHSSSKTKSSLWSTSVKQDSQNWKSLDNLKSDSSSSASSASSGNAAGKTSKSLLWQNTIHEDPVTWQSMDSLKSTSPVSRRRPLFWQKTLHHDCDWQSMEKMDVLPMEQFKNRLSKRRCSEPVAMVMGSKPARKPSLKSIQMMKAGSTDVPSVRTLFIPVLYVYPCQIFQSQNVHRQPICPLDCCASLFLCGCA